ncbi:hypothetical protein [Micrococcoides hystricis]|uniref:Uncharacterized protein n=1 Tax=Micrococcoides hystricis TaxID=1572761 RepID=A0ABV6PAW6_9MICC
MSRFRHRKEQRQLTGELGEGLWRRAHDRFVRALDRYHQILEGVTDTGDYNQLAELGNQLADLLPIVRDLCAQCQREHPSDELTVPNECRPVHAKLSSASNALATTAEAAALFRLGQVPVEQVRFRAARVEEDVAAAQQAALQHEI